MIMVEQGPGLSDLIFIEIILKDFVFFPGRYLVTDCNMVLFLLNLAVGSLRPAVGD
jgi:hypothetical protein